MQNKVLVISVHPDDETLGCGGTILRHKSEGDMISWLIITTVDKAHGWSEEIIERWHFMVDRVSSEYGFSETYELGFPTTRLDTIAMGDLVSSITTIIGKVEPSIIYMPNRSDIHTDHQIAFKAIISCTKNFRAPFIKRMLMYECLSETEFAPSLPENAFMPNVFVDISDYMERKLAIMSIYSSEMMPDNLPRSHSAIKALATFRGSRIGVQYAEAFVLLFEKC